MFIAFPPLKTKHSLVFTGMMPRVLLCAFPTLNFASMSLSHLALPIPASAMVFGRHQQGQSKSIHSAQSRVPDDHRHFHLLG